MSDSGKYFNPYDTVYFYIDNKLAISTTGYGGIIDSLALHIKHKVVLKVHGKGKASFFFNFDNFSSDTLCIWYYDSYGTWSIGPMNKKCNCKKNKVQIKTDSINIKNSMKK